MSRLQQAKALVIIPEIWRIFGLPGTPAKSCKSPFREDRAPSFSIFENGARWKDHATGETGDAVDFISKALGIRNSDACVMLIEMAASRSFYSSVRHEPATVYGPVKRPLSAGLQLPPLNCGTTTERDALTQIRKLPSRAGIELAVARELLGFCCIRDAGRKESAWILTDARRVNAQARRLDGLPWQGLPGTPKARTAKGSCAAWPIGVTDAATRPYLVFCEGGPDMLAGLTITARFAANADTVAVLAVTGAGQRIHPEALTLLRGKRVRIVPHLDKAGASAAVRWDSELTAAGAFVEWFDLRPFVPPGGKDLNDALAHNPDALAPLVRFAGEETEVAA